MKLFEVKNLSVFYPKKQVIFGVDFCVDKGELVAILGLNGSGKTTLLHGVCGFLKTQGQVLVDGKSLTELGDKQRAKNISFIPQVSGLKDGFSVLEVVLMGYNPVLPFFAYPTKDEVDRAKSVLAKVCPTIDVDVDFSKLSQGQKQLVILSRCIVQNSPVMIMDEPDSALDYNNRRKVLKIIKDEIKSNGYAGVIAMHDPNFALNYCDKLLILKDGKVLSQILPSSATIEEVEEKLSAIYQGVAVTRLNGKFVVGESDD